MNILSIYFSGTNNTKYIADELKRKCGNNNKFDEIRIGNDNFDIGNVIFANYDLFILGSPVYVEVFPKIVVNFIKDNLKDISNKKIVLYQTAASEKPPAMYELYNFFDKTNNIVVMTHIEMTNNFYLSGMFEYTEDDVRERLIENCNEKINKMVEVINGENDKFIDYEINKSKYKFGRFVYNAIDSVYLKRYAKRCFSSSNDCTGCSLCKNECPTNNIEVSKDNKNIMFSNKCACCMRCIQICPANAILYKNEKIRKMKMATL